MKVWGKIEKLMKVNKLAENVIKVGKKWIKVGEKLIKMDKN